MSIKPHDGSNICGALRQFGGIVLQILQHLPQAAAAEAMIEKNAGSRRTANAAAKAPSLRWRANCSWPCGST
jgi:hypothetical protein